MPKPRVETMDWWDECVTLKDEKSLRELGDRYGVTASAISNAFRRVGVTRKPAKSGPRVKRRPRSAEASYPVQPLDDSGLPPEPGEVPSSVAPTGRKRPAGITIKGLPGRRSPLNGHEHLLGTVSDTEIAERFGMAVGSVANYRRRKGIPAFRSGSKDGAGAATTPSRSKVEAYRGRVGPRPDASGRGPALAAEGTAGAVVGTQFAWRVTLESGEAGIVMGKTVVEAAMAVRSGIAGQVQHIERLGVLL